MASEWDILSEIIHAHRSLALPVRPTITHVKGHQDQKTPYANLSLPAQLNVDADRLADAYLAENPPHNFSRVPLLPSCGCQLELEAGTVTRDHKQSLREARVAPPYIQRLCHRHCWDKATFDDIAWESHRLALKRCDKHRTTLVKFLNDILPIGKMVHRYDPSKYPESCPSCNEPVEDRHHYWTCQAPNRIAWRADSILRLRKKLESIHTALPLQELLLEGYHWALHQHQQSVIKIPDGMETLAAAQHAIGWEHILKGRFTKQWIPIQDRYLRDIDKWTSKRTGKTWLTTVITTIFEEFFSQWTLRNEDRHGSDFRSQKDADKRHTMRELEYLYNRHQDSAPPHLQWLFSIPFLTRCQWTLNAIRQWINTWKPILEKSYATRLETG